jgi:hypothetical protein
MEKFMPNWGGERVLAETCYAEAVAAILPAGAVTLNYAEVVADPEAQFASLGWPIDAAKAASVVDASLHRFRLEAA